MTDRSSVMHERLRRLTMTLGALGALGVVVFWLYVVVRDEGMLTAQPVEFVAAAIFGALPFLLISFGRPRRPIVSLVVCLVLIGVNSYLYVFTLVSEADFAGLNAIGAIMYSWVIWGAGMVADGRQRERMARRVLPPRPDQH